MKRVVRIIAFGILLYAGWSALLVGCASSWKNEVELKDENDSLSYAVSMLLSEDVPGMMAQEGIDSTTIDAFIEGLRISFPLDDSPRTRALISGVYLGAEAADMLGRAEKTIYPDDADKKVDRELFLEALVASASNGTKAMDFNTAKEYYNNRIFRSRSEKFIADNNGRPGVVTLPSGLQYKVEKMGDGATATASSTVTCIYKGTFPNGATFASSRGGTEEFVVEEVVPGLSEVLTTLPVGTRCMVYIPWELAYGAEGKSNIPPYSALIYDLEIVGIR